MLLFANTTLLLCEYLNYLQWSEAAHGLASGLAPWVDLLCLLIPPLALMCVWLLVTRRSGPGAVLLSLNAVAGLGMVLWGDALSGMRSPLLLAIPFLLLVVAGLFWLLQGGSHTAEVRAPNVPVAIPLRVVQTGDSEFDHADAMGDPARIHTQAA